MRKKVNPNRRFVCCIVQFSSLPELKVIASMGLGDLQPLSTIADTKLADSTVTSTTTSTNKISTIKVLSGVVSRHCTHEEREQFNVKEFIKRHLTEGSKKMEYVIKDLHILLDLAKEVFVTCETLLEVKAPVNICGDIHGQYSDLMRIFNACGAPFKARYLFLGDYVDRGRHSLEVISLLLACRVAFPRNVYLLRGNHELSNINKVYGFLNELKQRFRTACTQHEVKQIYDHFNEVFALMPLAARVGKRILCMHGGLSPELKSLDDIRRIQRPLRVVRGLAQDLLWSDPEKAANGFEPNKVRAVSHVFGEEAVRQKCKQLDIDMVVRAHQVVEFGYAFFADRSLITVFSASRYHDELLNYAAVVVVDANLEVSFVQLKPQEFERIRKEHQDQRTADNPVSEEEKK